MTRTAPLTFAQQNEPLVLTFTPQITADPTKRTISGTIVRFGVASTDHRVIEAGALSTVRDPLSRVKMLIDHDQSRPVGYCIALDITDDAATATFQIPETADGDWALEQAANGLRDGLSVGLMAQPNGYHWDDNDVFHVTSAELYEVSLVAIPAYQDAQVEAVRASTRTSHTPRKETVMNRKQIEAALAAGKITQAQADAALAALEAVEGDSTDAPEAQQVEAGLNPAPPAAGAPVPAEYAAGPDGAPAPRGRTEDRPMSFGMLAQEVSNLAAENDMRGITQTVNAALAQQGVSLDEGNAFLGRPEWIGEIWQAKTSGRPWIDSIGGVKPLTGTKLEGFRWVREDEFEEDETYGRVKPYAGNFAEVPTGTRKTKKIEADASRWGFGTKIDSIFTDLGSPDLVASLFSLLAADFDQDSDKTVRDAIIAAATSPATQPTTLMGALQTLALDQKRIGANISKVWVAEDVFTQFAELKLADIPAWLLNALGIDMIGGRVDVASALGLELDFSLTAGTILGYDARAIQARQSPSIRLEALDIAHGAKDIGFFAYGGQLITDARAIRKYTLTASNGGSTGGSES